MGAAGVMIPAIRAVDVGMRFPAKRGHVDALGGVTLEVAPEEFVSLLGPSGCGKSTLLRIVAGLIRPTSGEVSVHGQRLDGPNSEVGIVFQSPVLLPWRTVLANVELQVEVRGLDRVSYRDEARRLLALVGLNGFESSYPYQLSGGMQQRVSLCRALIHNPRLLLMDEPFGALDALTREQMNLELQRVWMETKKMVLFVTHSIPEAVFLSDRVLVMSPRPGRIEGEIRVALPRPRTLATMEAPEFLRAAAEARTLMHLGGIGG
jgi:NitT/TauT family transport system ATP-binding protein